MAGLCASHLPCPAKQNICVYIMAYSKPCLSWVVLTAVESREVIEVTLYINSAIH